MNELMALRDLLAVAAVPDGVLSVNYDDLSRRWDIHMQEEAFRATFDTFNHIYHSTDSYRMQDHYRLECHSQGVRFFAITAEVPADVYVDTRSRFAGIASEEQEAALNDPVARARSNW